MIKEIFKLVRFPNLFLLAIAQLLLHYVFLKGNFIPTALGDGYIWALVLSTVFIAAGGYIINNIQDQSVDAQNGTDKNPVGKSISETAAYNAYFVLTVGGVGIGYWLSNYIDKPIFFGLFVLSAVTLYLYATSFKGSLLIGNILIAFMGALSQLMVPIFDLIPVIFPETKSQMATLFLIITDMAAYAFILTLFREMVKDMEDIKGDGQQGHNTLPLVIGLRKTGFVLASLSSILVLYLVYYTYSNLMVNQRYLAVIYLLIAVIAPLVFFAFKIIKATEKKEFAMLSMLLKIMLVLGLAALYVITYSISNHV